MLAIRFACLNDINELLELAEEWLNPLWDKAIKRGYLHLTIRNKKITAFTQHYIYVADTQHNRIVGFVDFLIWNDWLTKKEKILIQHVYVAKKFRRRGIAKCLLERIIGDFKPDYAIVDTKPEKFPHAEGLYKKVGFKKNPKRKWLERYGE